MKKIFFILSFANALNVLACDVCGCVSSINTQGVFADYSNHFIGMRYAHQSFQNKLNHDGIYHESLDRFNRLDLNVRILLGKNKFLILSTPFIINHMQSDTENYKLQGLGDVQLLLGIHFPKMRNVDTKHNFILNAGAKLPTGQSAYKDLWGNILNMNLQLGSGSVDFIGQGVYIYKKNNWSIINQLSYKYNLKNKRDFKFGNSINFNASFYYLQKMKNVSLAYIGGLGFESMSPNFDNDSKVFNTGGQILNAMLSSQLFIKQFRFSAFCQVPMYSKFITDNLTEREINLQFGADLIYFFNQKN